MAVWLASRANAPGERRPDTSEPSCPVQASGDACAFDAVVLPDEARNPCVEYSEGRADVLKTQLTFPTTPVTRRRLLCVVAAVAPMQALHARLWLLEEGWE